MVNNYVWNDQNGYGLNWTFYVCYCILKNYVFAALSDFWAVDTLFDGPLWKLFSQTFTLPYQWTKVNMTLKTDKQVQNKSSNTLTERCCFGGDDTEKSQPATDRGEAALLNMVALSSITKLA